MEPAEKFLAINTDELEWEDGEKFLSLPPGVKIKIIAKGRDAVSDRRDLFVQFPPGYREPRHTHVQFHSILVLEGEMHVAGKVLKRGDYVYGGGVEEEAAHGPYHYPVGCTVFASTRAVELKSHEHRLAE
ncbi:cupin domain-containing protein [Nitrospinota bacterium]